MSACELHQIEEQVAGLGAEFMAAIIRLARLHAGRDPDVPKLLAELKSCQVIITAFGQQLEIEARAQSSDGLYQLWSGTFSESEVH